MISTSFWDHRFGTNNDALVNPTPSLSRAVRHTLAHAHAVPTLMSAFLLMRPLFDESCRYLIVNDETVYTDTARLVSLLGVNRALPVEVRV